MSKIVRRFLLDDSWSIGRNESWFTDMAAQGLHLKNIGPIFATFEKSEPSSTRYRIDVLDRKPTGEQLEVYKQCGWNFVTSRGNFSVFSSPESSNSLELHTDPEEQSYTLLNLDKRLKNNLYSISIIMLLFFCMLFSVFFLQGAPFLSMIKGQLFLQILFSIVELYVFYNVIRNYMVIHRLRKSLLKGKAINHREAWKKSRFINGAVGGVFITIALLGIIVPWIEIAKRETYILTKVDMELPVVRLSEIEQNPELKPMAGYNSQGVDWGNRAIYDWNLLAPVQYEVDEHGIIKGQKWEDNSREYSPSISTQYYQLVFPKMAHGLIEDMMDRYLYDPEVVPEQIKNTQFDNMYVTVDGICKHIFASWGNKVIHISYYGNKDMEHVVSILTDMAFK